MMILGCRSFKDEHVVKSASCHVINLNRI